MKGKKSSFSPAVSIFISGSFLWLSSLALPWPGICLITGWILAFSKPLQASSPKMLTILGFLEKDLLPITLLEFLINRSKTGAQL